MADLIGKVEGIAGLALIGGLAYGALRFGPELIRGFRDAMTGLRDSFAGAGDVVDSAKTAAGAVGDTINILTPNNPLDSARDTINIITTPGADPGAIGDSAFKALFDALGLFNPALGKGGNLVVDTLGLGGGAAPGQTISPFVAASASAANVVQQINDAAAAATAAAVASMSDEVKEFLTAGKSSVDLTPVATGGGATLYVSPTTGAYSVEKGGQLTAGGSPGSLEPRGVYAPEGNVYSAPGTALGGSSGSVMSSKSAAILSGDSAAAKAWRAKYGGGELMRITTLPRILASKVVPDSDLDLRPYGVVAAFSRAPVGGSWPTETLDWGDVPAGEPSSSFSGSLSPYHQWITLKTFEAPPGDSYKWRFKIVTHTSDSTANFKITADGVDVATASNHWAGTLTVDAYIPAGSTVTVQGYNNANYVYTVKDTSTVQNLGIVGGAKTFNLSGKWLALGIDMKGLVATVKIQGVEMPYSDYPKYFPISPAELKIPGDWTPDQVRPVIEVYS